MPEVTVSPKSITLRMELHRNGVTVECFVPTKGKGSDHMGGEEVSYVYDSVEEAASELPGIVSVIKEMMGLNKSNPTKNEPDLGKKKEYKDD